MKIYKGKRLGNRETVPDVEVTVNDKPLKHQVYHSPTGLNWGYGGSGPADLARSILWDVLGFEPSMPLYQDFKQEFVAGWKDDWVITSDEIEKWMAVKVLGKGGKNKCQIT